MKAAKPTFIEQLRDNLRNIGPLWMVAGIHQHLRLRTKFLRHEQRRSPVREISGIKRWLEELILDQEAHTSG